MPSIDVWPRVNPVQRSIGGGGGRINGRVWARTRARACRVAGEAEHTSRPLGECRCRHCAAYLALNLINEGESASVVARPTTSLLRLHILPSHFFPLGSPATVWFSDQEEEWRGNRSADGRQRRKGPLNVHLRPKGRGSLSFCPRNKGLETGTWLFGRRQEAFLRVVEPLYYWSLKTFLITFFRCADIGYYLFFALTCMVRTRAFGSRRLPALFSFIIHIFCYHLLPFAFATAPSFINSYEPDVVDGVLAKRGRTELCGVPNKKSFTSS